MHKQFIADKKYKGEDYSQNPLPRADYENCVFTNCNFAGGFLDNQNFMECEFVDCDLTNTNIKHTIFKETVFRGSKLVGLRFEDCNDLLLSMRFQSCNLTLASFFGLSLQGTHVVDCLLVETDFSEADLSQALFDQCNLEKALFHRTLLYQTDFTTSFNLDIDPEQNQLKKTQFSKENLIGLLKKYDIVVT
ncbi:pentapeptide repeat-containing protein [Flagellimonas flava]|uniref:Uncharacterized protein YjbI, contains pentapeptide repeats n=1 Tax=Flagellimonas flava TaxID=570519 RepID=A0A1M5M866_9FLAO|nr:pentapeptide repeat-containing protein [Allomuricauda flava]SHG73418.1 Uncharacterized protein YjbI, contains pentapeptide repeats [Allomuricauda flava]